MVQSNGKTLTVQPGRGSNVSGAIQSLTAALKQAQAGTLLKLLPGKYSQETGEQFPFFVPDGVSIVGSDPDPGSTIIQGGGSWQVPGMGPVKISLVLGGLSQLQGITISYLEGTAIWIQTGHPRLENCRITNCGQDGLRVIGSAMPRIAETLFEDIQNTGVRWGEEAKGEIRRCQITKCSTGLSISAQAAPFVVATRIFKNQLGAEASGDASPVFRQVQITQNHTVGFWVQDDAKPDLGRTQNEGNNVIRHNAEHDIRHDGTQSLLSVGNDVISQRLRGHVILAASQVPAAAAVAPLRRGQLSAPHQKQPSPQPAPSSARFRDLEAHWAAAFCDALAQRGLIKGFSDGTFRPDALVTRAQFAALVSAAFPDVPENQPATNFVDVSSDFWASKVIGNAQRQGFLSGYPDHSFRPDASMTRIQAIIAIANGLQLPAAPASNISIYQDRAQIPSYATNSLAAATQKRLVVNHPNPLQLRPLESISRAEVAALVYQGLVAQGNAPVINSEFIVRPDTTQTSFTDLSGHWSEAFIKALVQQNWIRGFEDGSFRPDEPMTRAQYATLIKNAFNPQPRRADQVFVDVPSGHWAAAAISAAYRSGFLSGFPDATFAPNHGMVRVQTWISLVSGLNLPVEAASASDPFAPFIDTQEVPTYAKKATAQAIRLGLVTNPPDRPQLRPNQVASRADISVAVYQALVVQNRLPPIDSPYIVQTQGS